MSSVPDLALTSVPEVGRPTLYWPSGMPISRFVRWVGVVLAVGATLVGFNAATAEAESLIRAPSAPQLSGDGRWAVFDGVDADGRRTTWRADLLEGGVTELSPLPEGARPGDTRDAAISADGCVVAVVSQIPFDLFRDDDRGERWDVYRTVTPECGGEIGAWELVSVGRDGTALDHALIGDPPAVSGSGAEIAYVHSDPRFENIEIGLVTLVDLTVPPADPGRTSEVVGVPVEVPNRTYTYRGAREPVISANGRHLAFTADFDASALLPGWADGAESGGPAVTQVYVWDRLPPVGTPPVLLASAGAEPVIAGASSPTISANGRFVAFASADRLVADTVTPSCRPTCRTQIYRIDRDADRNGIFDEEPPVTMLVSAVDAGRPTSGIPVAGDENSSQPTISADGGSVGFITDSTNLLSSRRGGGGQPLDGDLVVAEIQLGEIRRVLDGVDAAGVPGAHAAADMSDDGRVVVFETAAGSVLAPAHQLVVDAERTLGIATTTPRLALAELDFGSVRLGYESDELFITVQNAGPGAFIPESMVTSSPQFVITGGTCARGIIVAAGESCDVNIVFRPDDQRSFEATLTVLGAGDISVTSTLRGAAGDPTFRATPGGADVGVGVVATEAGRMAFDIRNVGFVPVEMGDVTISGRNPDDFAVIAESCTDRALNPTASCSVEVAFNPTDSGYRSALVIVGAATGQYTAAVIGGYAHYVPQITVATEQVAAGSSFEVTGSGFPAESELALGLDDGSVPFADTTTDAEGGFFVLATLPERIRTGEQRLVVTGTGDATATATVEVVANTQRQQTPLPGLGLG